MPDFLTEYTTLAARVAADDIRKQTLPKSADEYKVELPQDFKLPDEFKDFKIADNDPRLPQVRALAHELGLDQAGMSKLLQIQVAHEIADAQAMKEARAAEVTKLGPQGPSRIDAIGTWLKARLGEKDGAAILDRFVLASDIGAVEKLITQFSSQGTQPFNQQHREHGKQPISDAEYDAMTPSQKLAYARQHQKVA